MRQGKAGAQGLSAPCVACTYSDARVLSPVIASPQWRGGCTSHSSCPLQGTHILTLPIGAPPGGAAPQARAVAARLDSHAHMHAALMTSHPRPPAAPPSTVPNPTPSPRQSHPGRNHAGVCQQRPERAGAVCQPLRPHPGHCAGCPRGPRGIGSADSNAGARRIHELTRAGPHAVANEGVAPSLRLGHWQQRYHRHAPIRGSYRAHGLVAAGACCPDGWFYLRSLLDCVAGATGASGLDHIPPVAPGWLRAQGLPLPRIVTASAVVTAARRKPGSQPAGRHAPRPAPLPHDHHHAPASRFVHGSFSRQHALLPHPAATPPPPPPGYTRKDASARHYYAHQAPCPCRYGRRCASSAGPAPTPT